MALFLLLDVFMTTERLVRVFAGSFVLVSVVLAHVVNDVPLFERPTWLWFTLFVGANLLQSGFTRWCLLEHVLEYVGVRREPAVRSVGPGDARAR